jgi:hypothetical protein
MCSALRAAAERKAARCTAGGFFIAKIRGQSTFFFKFGVRALFSAGAYRQFGLGAHGSFSTGTMGRVGPRAIAAKCALTPNFQQFVL